MPRASAVAAADDSGKGQPDGAGARKAAEWRGLWVIFGRGLNGAPCEVDIKSDSSSAEVGLRHSHCFCLVMFKCQWERRKKKRKIFFFQRTWKRKSNLKKKTVKDGSRNIVLR